MEKIKYLEKIISYWGLLLFSMISMSAAYILISLGNLFSIMFSIAGIILFVASFKCMAESKKQYRKALVEDIAINRALLTILRSVKPKPKKKAKRKK